MVKELLINEFAFDKNVTACREQLEHMSEERFTGKMLGLAVVGMYGPSADEK